MKFVCDRCQTRYSIADDKVRGKILKVRCKSCQNVITVREAGAATGEAPESPQVPEERTVMAPMPTPEEPFIRQQPRQTATGAAAVPAHGMAPPPPPPAREEVQWYMALSGNRTGPYSRKGLLDKLAVLPNGADVHVWNETMDGWKPPEQVTAIAQELQARRRPAVPPVPGVPIHSGPHAVPGVPGRTTTGAQPIAAAPQSPRRTSHSLPAPTGGHHGHGPAAGAAGEVPLAAAAEAPAPSGAAGFRIRKTVNGVAAHTEGAAPAAQPAASARTLEPAAPALNGEQPWKEPPVSELPLGAPAGTGTDVVHPAPSWQPSKVPAVTTQARHRNAKFIVASLGIVAVIVVLVTLSFLKKAPTTVEATKPATTPVADNSFAQLADKLAQQAKEPAAAPVEPVIVPKVEPSKETTAVVRPGKNGRIPKIKTKRGREIASARGLSGLSPPPMVNGSTTQGAAADSAGAAPPSYMGSERQVQLRGGGGAKSTPGQGDITRVINNNKAGIKVCYQRALLKDSSLTHGKIVVRVTLGLSGRVKAVAIDGPPSFLTLQPCIKEMVARWAFPPSSEEYGTEFSYVFQGNE